MSKLHEHIVRVNWSLCYGCEKCIIACPTNVFVNITDTTGRDVVEPIRESDCILCLICEIVCPVKAITIERKGGSEDTLRSLLQGIEEN